jgi:hypothetical protein
MEKVPRCCRELPPQAKFHNQQNLVAGGAKAEPPNFANRAKIGPDERKRKGTKVRGQEFATLKICLEDKKITKVSR